MKTYEFMRFVSLNDTAALNTHGRNGWHVVAYIPDSLGGALLMEREIEINLSGPAAVLYDQIRAEEQRRSEVAK